MLLSISDGKVWCLPGVRTTECVSVPLSCPSVCRGMCATDDRVGERVGLVWLS